MKFAELGDLQFTCRIFLEVKFSVYETAGCSFKASAFISLNSRIISALLLPAVQGWVKVVEVNISDDALPEVLASCLYRDTTGRDAARKKWADGINKFQLLILCLCSHETDNMLISEL